MKIFNIFYNRYLISSISLIFINLTFSGCYSLRETTIKNNNQIKIYKIETMNGDIVDFRNDKNGYALLYNNEIISIKVNGNQETFPISNIKKYYTEKFDIAKTIWLVIGCAAAWVILFGIIMIIGMDGRSFGG